MASLKDECALLGRRQSSRAAQVKRLEPVSLRDSDSGPRDGGSVKDSVLYMRLGWQAGSSRTGQPGARKLGTEPAVAIVRWLTKALLRRLTVAARYLLMLDYVKLCCRVCEALSCLLAMSSDDGGETARVRPPTRMLGWQGPDVVQVLLMCESVCSV